MFLIKHWKWLKLLLQKIGKNDPFIGQKVSWFYFQKIKYKKWLFWQREIRNKKYQKMSQLLKLEMRVKILEKAFENLLKNNSLISHPDQSDMGTIKMEIFQEMKKKYPNEKIEYPKL